MSESFRSIKVRPGGFTLVELMVAASISILIVVMLGSMFASLMGTTSRSNQRIDAFRDARAALQMMERDLAGLNPAKQTAYFALDKIWQDTSNDKYSNPSDPAPNRQLFALIIARNPTASPTPIPGDLCAVGYYCQWDKTKHCYTLRRYFKDSFTTYKAIKSQVVNGGLNYTGKAALFTPGINDDLLASYIWNLNIRVFKADGTEDTTTYPLVIDPSQPNVILPAAIEVSFFAMSPQAARTVTAVSSNPSDWMDTTSSVYTRLIKPNVYEFHTRIDL
ncbi:MAG: PulJ/GspJ family protein [Chthoniobacterales bacterium]